MASHIGSPVWVKLKPPQNILINGIVQDLVPNSHLTLRHVSTPGSPNKLDHFTVQISAIEDLGVIEAGSTPQDSYIPPTTNAHLVPGTGTNDATTTTTTHPVHHVSAPPQHSIANPTPQRQVATFTDPAIVSYGNASPVQAQQPSRLRDVQTPVKTMLAKAGQNLPSPSSPFIAEARQANTGPRPVAVKQTPSKQTSKASPALPDAPQDAAQIEGGSKKKLRRGQKAKRQTPTPLGLVDAPPVMNAEVSRNGNDMNGSVKRGKGWRSTPLLQPSPQNASPSGSISTKKSRRKPQEEEFAAGDTTDIPDVDFDFEGELKKFDKHKVFDEIRQGDTTADEDLLVSHNRARPGTYGGKNLHPTESVLTPTVAPTLQNNGNEVDSSSDADTELNSANNRSSSRHSISRTTLGKKLPSRSNSGQLEARPHPLATSMSSDRAASRSGNSLAGRKKAASSLTASSPRPDRTLSPTSLSVSRLSDTRQANHIANAHFVIDSQATSCPVLLPGALDNLEAASVAHYGLTREAFTESAAIRIAEATLGLFDANGGVRRPSRTNTLRSNMTASAVLNSPTETPVVVILAGNHLIGARALAAARHLLRRNLKVIIAESNFEADSGQDAYFKAQSTVLRRRMREGANLKRGVWKKALGYIKNLSGPPVAIVDALLTGTTYDALQGPQTQQECREMIDWANRSRAPVLSVGCPSGVSGDDGQATVVDGEPLAVRPDKVLALGAPMQGLLKAMESGEEWEIALADIGIDIALKSEEAVLFNGRWVVDLTFVERQTSAEEVK